MTHNAIEKPTGSEPVESKSKFPATGYVRLKQILSPNGPLPISRSGFWAGIKVGKFPQPRKVSQRVTVWRAEDIHALLVKIEQGAV